MMWRIFNKLFGWDYIGWSGNTFSRKISGVERVFKEEKPLKRVYYTNTHNEVLTIIKEPEEVIWLTCSSDKYFGVDDDNTKEPPDNK